MSTMADYDDIAPMLTVRIDTQQERPTTLALVCTTMRGGDESHPLCHVHMSVSLDASQVRRLIAVLREGVGGDGT